MLNILRTEDEMVAEAADVGARVAGFGTSSADFVKLLLGEARIGVNRKRRVVNAVPTFPRSPPRAGAAIEREGCVVLADLVQYILGHIKTPAASEGQKHRERRERGHGFS